VPGFFNVGLALLDESLMKWSEELLALVKSKPR